MTKTLNNSLQIWTLAKDLDLNPKEDPIAAIVQYCVQCLRAFLAEFPCKTLSELLKVAEAKLDTKFIDIHSDEDLHRVRDEFVRKGEEQFKLLEKYLGEQVYAITFLRLNPKKGDRRYVSVIDCRGEKGWRAYFSRWHELAHLLTLTSQMRLRFCRSHAESDLKDPEEKLMDVIAGEIGFLPEITKHHIDGSISFAKLDELREVLCPEASFQSCLYGFSRIWPEPCCLIETGLGYKKSEEARLTQNLFDFCDSPTEKFRVLHVHSNKKARASAIFVPKYMRVPETSVIYKIFQDGLSDGEAVEDLCWWESSNGKCLDSRTVFVQARRSGDRVFALITSN